MKRKSTKPSLLDKLMANVKPIIVLDVTKDYLEYDHLTGDKIYHGRFKEAIKIHVPYVVCVNTTHIKDKKSKLDTVIELTYHTVDSQSVSETIIDVDIMAMVNVTDAVNLVSSKTILRVVSDPIFDAWVESGKIQLEKPNISYQILSSG